MLPVPFRLAWGGWALLRSDGTGISILRGDYPEKPELLWIKRYLKAGMTFVDVGANQGIYSVLAARAVGSTGHVYSFEPSPSELRKLRANIRFNRLRNVSVIESAVGDNAGETTLFAADSVKGGFSGLKRPSEYLKISTMEISVPVTTLDQFCAEYSPGEINFLKVDVEGAEMMLVAGAEGILSTRPRPVLQFEFADGRSREFGYRAVELLRSLEDYGFNWFEYSVGGLKPHDPRESYSYLNLVGIPKERLHEVSEVENHEQSNG